MPQYNDAAYPMHREEKEKTQQKEYIEKQVIHVETL